MKIFNYSLIISSLLCIVACQDPAVEPEKPQDISFSLSEKNIMVSGLDQDCIISVNNADPNRGVEIYVDYLDKENIKALDVQFTGLEEGVEVNYLQVYNYSMGSQKVLFLKEGKEFTYDFSVEVGKPVVKLNSLTVNGVSALSGEVKMSSSVDLSALVVEFELSPADAKMFVGETQIESGAVVDFTDKLNGVTFVARCSSEELSQNVKVVTTGINEITRLWGCYYKPFSEGVDATWFGTKVDAESSTIRTIALTDEYVFLSKDKDSNNPTGGVYAVSIADPNNVKLLSQNGLSEGTRIFGICSLENKVLASTFTMSSGGRFVIYSYSGVNSDPVVEAEYTLPEAMRLGDKIRAEGTWQDGKVWLYDSTSGKKVLYFTVSGGKLSAKPTVVDLDTKMGNYGIFYPYKNGQYVWGGGSPAATLFEVDGTFATSKYAFPTSIVAAPAHGISFFTFNEENYMAYVVLRNSYSDGQMRVSPLISDSLSESVDAIEKSYRFYLGDPNATEDATYIKNGNGSGDGAFRIIDGKYYYAAFVPGTGLSLFEIK